MKTRSTKCYYRKVIKGRVRYAEVEIELDFSTSVSRVTDNCEWKTLKESYPNFQEFEILKIWKQSSIEAANWIIESIDLPCPIEIKIKDLAGIYVDTLPSLIGAAVIIGVFDLCDRALNQNDLKIIDDFITENNVYDAIPNYKNLVLSNHKLS